MSHLANKLFSLAYQFVSMWSVENRIGRYQILPKTNCIYYVNSVKYVLVCCDYI